MTRRKRITYRFARPGKGTTEYQEWLVGDAPNAKVLFLDAYHGRLLRVRGRTILEPQAPIVWFIFPGAWHEIGRFHRADGAFTGWYTNFCTPVAFHDHVWSTTDLFLDHWLAVSGDGQWLDEEELEQASRAGLLTEGTLARLAQEREWVSWQLRAGRWPPQIAREYDLARATTARQTTGGGGGG